MLGYYLDNKPFLLRQDTSVLIKYRNPACFMDSLQNFSGLGIDIPVNDHNQSMLGLPNRFDRDLNRDSRKFTGFEIRYSGVLLIAGTLVVQSANGDTYSGWCQSELGALGEAQQEKYINEMDWPDNQNFQYKENYNDSADEYGNKEVYNLNFWEGKGRETDVAVEYYDTNGYTQEKEQISSVIGYDFYKNYTSVVNRYTITDIKSGCVISPFLFLRYVIKKSLQLNRFNIARNDMIPDEDSYDTSFLKDIQVYNNFNILDLVIDTVPVQQPWWSYEYYQMVLNEYNSIPHSGFTWQLGLFKYADLLPRKSYKDFLLGLQNFINYIFHFKTNGDVDIIDRNALLDTTAIDLNEFIRGEWEMGEQKSLRLKFVSEIDKDDAKYGEEYEDLSDRWQNFKDAVKHLSELDNITDPEFGELRLVEDLNEIYEYGWYVLAADNEARLEEQIDVLGWTFASSGPQPYVYGDGDKEEEIKTTFSTTQRTFQGGHLVKQKGNISKMRSLWNDYTLRLLPGNSVQYKRSLYWDGEDGLFKNRWEKWARFWKDRLPASASFLLPLNKLIQVQHNITNKFRTQQGEFIIEEMETEFGMHQIGETRIKGYKV